jgi:predicted NUDIX family phosphoesterase
MGQVLDGSEQILVIPAAKLEWQRHSPGFVACPRRRLEEVLSLATFVPRTEGLEHGPGGLAWLQVVVYALITNAGKVFAYRRPAKGGERRLAGRCSIGIGGHVNPVPAWSGDDTGILLNLYREVREEIGVEGMSVRLAGLLWDDRDDIGKRHLGLVYLVDVLDAGRVRPQTAEVEPLGWFSPDELHGASRASGAGIASDWEGWSGLLVPHVEAILAPPRDEAKTPADVTVSG